MKASAVGGVAARCFAGLFSCVALTGAGLTLLSDMPNLNEAERQHLVAVVDKLQGTLGTGVVHFSCAVLGVAVLAAASIPCALTTLCSLPARCASRRGCRVWAILVSFIVGLLTLCIASELATQRETAVPVVEHEIEAACHAGVRGQLERVLECSPSTPSSPASPASPASASASGDGSTAKATETSSSSSLSSSSSAAGAPTVAAPARAMGHLATCNTACSAARELAGDCEQLTTLCDAKGFVPRGAGACNAAWGTAAPRAKMANTAAKCREVCLKDAECGAYWWDSNSGVCGVVTTVAGVEPGPGLECFEKKPSAVALQVHFADGPVRWLWMTGASLILAAGLLLISQTGCGRRQMLAADDEESDMELAAE